MKYKGYGVIYNPIKKKIVVNFREVGEYETNDPEEIKFIENSGYCQVIEEVIILEEIEENDKDMTPKIPDKPKRKKAKPKIEAIK